jgi:hypothetical protein
MAVTIAESTVSKLATVKCARATKDKARRLRRHFQSLSISFSI